MSADASVREARANDIPAVANLQSASWRSGFAGIVPPQVLATFEPQTFARVWRRSLEQPPSPAHRLLVACSGPVVVGLLALGPADDDAQIGDLLALTVAPDHRRQGHGSRLVQAAADLTGERGGSHLQCWVPVADELTQGFLRGAGFGPDGAYRDRVVGPDGETARETRLLTRLPEPSRGGVATRT